MTTYLYPTAVNPMNGEPTWDNWDLSAVEDYAPWYVIDPEPYTDNPRGLPEHMLRSFYAHCRGSHEVGVNGMLRPGMVTRFGNGSMWAVIEGKVYRVAFDRERWDARLEGPGKTYNGNMGPGTPPNERPR